MDTFGTGSPTLDDLITRLRRSRRRARLTLLLHGLAWSALLAAVLYLVLAVGELFGNPLLQPVWLWSGAAFVLLLAVALPIGLTRTPSLLEMARRADRHFGLRERASTAWEVSRSAPQGRTNAEVRTALFRDAARHAARIEPGQLVRIRPPRGLFVAVVLVLVVAGVQWAAPQWRASGNGFDSAGATSLSGEERDEVVANLRRAAELMEQEAEQRQDTYLQAVARSFAELGDTVERGELTASETRQELDRLLEHANRAFGTEAPSGQIPPDGRAADPAAQPPQGATAEDRTGALASPAPGDDRLVTPDLERLLERLEIDAEARAAASNFEGGVFADSYALQIQEEGQRRALQRLRSEAAGGQPVGGAEQSTAGESPLAGQGTQPLEGEPQSPTLESVATGTEEVLLPGEIQAGERVEVDLTPEADFTEIADSGLDAVPVWQAVREAELRRELLTPRDRAVVSLYFARDESETDSGN